MSPPIPTGLSQGKPLSILLSIAALFTAFAGGYAIDRAIKDRCRQLNLAASCASAQPLVDDPRKPPPPHQPQGAEHGH